MPGKVEYSPRAIRDLDEIWDYIDKNLGNTDAAQRTVSGIMDSIDSIAAFPKSGPKLIFEDVPESGYRFIVYKHYMAFYRLKPDDTLYVDRIVYGRRDYMSLLFPDL